LRPGSFVVFTVYAGLVVYEQGCQQFVVISHCPVEQGVAGFIPAVDISPMGQEDSYGRANVTKTLCRMPRGLPRG